MISKLRKAQEREEGFTLIELLVVVIIIGILAAIAIPAFLNQRQRAYQAALTSDVRNLALELEAGATANNGVYVDSPAVPATYSVSTDQVDVTTTITYTPTADNTGFCLAGVRTDLAGANVLYESLGGGISGFNAAAVACDTTVYGGTAVTLVP